MPGLNLEAKLGLDASGFAAGLSGAGRVAHSFASRLTTIVAGAFTVGAIRNFTSHTLQLASALSDVADRLGVSVEWLQETEVAARLAGARIENLQKFLEYLAIAREEALGGNKQRLTAFQRLGVSRADLQTGTLESLFDQIGKAVQSGNQQVLIPAIREIGGRGAVELVAAFTNGLDSGRELARKSGAVMSQDLVDQLDFLQDAIDLFGRVLTVQTAPAIIFAARQIALAVGHIQASGSFWGAFSGAGGFRAGARTLWEGIKFYSGAAWIAQNVFGKNIMSPGVWAQSSDQFKKALDAAAGARESALADTLDTLDSLERQLREFRAAREAMRNAPPTLNVEPRRAIAPRAPASDALISIGNFLGRNPALVNSIANLQLQVSRQHLMVSQQMLAVLRIMADARRMTQLGMLVPTT